MRLVIYILLCFCILSCNDTTDTKPQQKSDIDSLISQLQSEGPTQKFSVVEKIGELKEKAAPAIPELTAILKDSSSSNRLFQTTVDAVIKIGDEAIPALEEALQHDKWNMRLYTLKQMQVLSTENVAKLQKSIEQNLNDKNSEVRDEAVELMGKLNDSVVPSLIEKAKDTAWQVRKTVAESLSMLQSKKGLDALISLSSDEDWRVRMASIKGIIKIGFNDTKTLSFLLTKEITDHRVKEVISEMMLEKLQTIEENSLELSKEAIEGLIVAIENESNYKRNFTLKMLAAVKHDFLASVLSQNLEKGQNVANSLKVISSSKNQEQYKSLLQELREKVDRKTKEQIDAVLMNIK